MLPFKREKVATTWSQSALLYGLIVFATALGAFGCKQKAADEVEQLRARSDLILYCRVENIGSKTRLVCERVLLSKPSVKAKPVAGSIVDPGLPFDSSWEGAVIPYKLRSSSLYPWTILRVVDGRSIEGLTIEELASQLENGETGLGKTN